MSNFFVHHRCFIFIVHHRIGLSRLCHWKPPRAPLGRSDPILFEPRWSIGVSTFSSHSSLDSWVELLKHVLYYYILLAGWSINVLSINILYIDLYSKYIFSILAALAAKILRSWCFTADPNIVKGRFFFCLSPTLKRPCFDWFWHPDKNECYLYITPIWMLPISYIYITYIYISYNYPKI